MAIKLDFLTWMETLERKKRFPLKLFLKFLEFFTHIFPKVSIQLLSRYSAVYVWGYFQKTPLFYINYEEKSNSGFCRDHASSFSLYQSTCVVQRYIYIHNDSLCFVLWPAMIIIFNCLSKETVLDYWDQFMKNSFSLQLYALFL